MPYSASKAAVVSLAQTTAYELVGTNIRVNAICPGLIETDMTRAAFGLARATGKVGKIGVLNPTLRQGLGFEVANLALWLASGTPFSQTSPWHALITQTSRRMSMDRRWRWTAVCRPVCRTSVPSCESLVGIVPGML